VYAAVIKSGCGSVSQISEATGIHSQDICKIAIKLEEKGLVNRTFGKPLVIEALPIKIALKNLIISEKQKTKEKIRELEDSFADIQKSLGQKQEMIEPKRETTRLWVLQLETPATTNKIITAFENVRTQYDALGSTETFLRMSGTLAAWLGKLKQRSERMKVRFLIIDGIEKSRHQIFDYAEEIERAVTKTADFELRSYQGESTADFAIIDSKEVWFPIHLGDKRYIMVANSQEIVKLVNQEFERIWNSPETKTLTKLNRPFPKQQQGSNATYSKYIPSHLIST
jgi:sugar-specific transcriptional regulator TrmB